MVGIGGSGNEHLEASLCTAEVFAVYMTVALTANTLTVHFIHKSARWSPEKGLNWEYSDIGNCGIKKLV